MNAYKISDLSAGMEEHFQVTVSEERMEQFYSLTGDGNPLHREDAFAKEKGFPGRVVYGMLTASMISTLGGMYLPGKNCIIQEVEVKFAKPVLVGDVLTVSGKVCEVYEELKCLMIRVEIYNQKGDKVLRGRLKAGVLDE